MSTPPASEYRGDAPRSHGAPALRVLVADDDRDTVDTLTQLLRDSGYTVYTAYSGKEVLPTVRLVRPDAVILDIVVPGMSGYAVAQEIRHSFIDARCPLLIAMSGIWKERADQRVAEQVGFDHHLLKPCEPAALMALLQPLSARPAS
jgi:CheY-like chemotaxis protein